MSRYPGSIKWGIILIILGLIFLLHNYGIISFGRIIGILWPLLLIWWGYVLIRRGRRDRHARGFFDAFGDKVATVSTPEIDHSTVFGDVRIKVESPEFSGGKVSAVFGDLRVDLREVQRITGTGHLDLDSVFGDVMIHLPANIAFEIRSSNAFGSLIAPDGTRLHGKSFRSSNFETATEKLIIHASQVFGNTEVIQ